MSLISRCGFVATPIAMAAVPFQSCEPAMPGVLHLLLAPLGQLSADGQLRELIAERRQRWGEGVALWYLPPAALAALLPDQPPGQEGVVARDPAAITWLQLRFGGTVSTAPLASERLQALAGNLPPRAPLAALAL
jgi:hypothetical protein